jgi:hypothetical protein
MDAEPDGQEGRKTNRPGEQWGQEKSGAAFPRQARGKRGAVPVLDQPRNERLEA